MQVGMQSSAKLLPISKVNFAGRNSKTHFNFTKYNVRDGVSEDDASVRVPT